MKQSDVSSGGVALCAVIAVAGFGIAIGRRTEPVVTHGVHESPAPGSIVDLGTINRAVQRVTATAVVRNETDRALTEIQAFPSCGCIHVGLHDKSIAPGAELIMPIEYGVSPSAGDFEYQIVVRSATNSSWRSVVRVKGTVRTDRSMVPPGVRVTAADRAAESHVWSLLAFGANIEASSTWEGHLVSSLRRETVAVNCQSASAPPAPLGATRLSVGLGPEGLAFIGTGRPHEEFWIELRAVGTDIRYSVPMDVQTDQAATFPWAPAGGATSRLLARFGSR